ncbi:MAG TPA: cobalamin-dependent protein [Thermoleophilia bacterium]|nr:cobalamin-dependent protein [Thermoleophilia bacterium]
MSTDVFGSISAAIEELQPERAIGLTKEALAGGLDPASIIADGLTPGMRAVGDAFENGDAFLPELLVAADIFRSAVELVKPHLAAEAEPKGTVVIGTVAGDIHELGKDIVKLSLETSGFAVYDVGIDTPAEKFAEEVKKSGAEVVGASAMLTSTLPQVRAVVEAVRAADPTAKILVGGAPVTQANADHYGADAFAPNAAAATRTAEELAKIVRAARS